MAQLPPKIPNLTPPTWPNFTHLNLPSMATLNPTATTGGAAQQQPQQPSWVDEFFDFTAAKRGSHRRSASDSIAFLEAPLLEECKRFTSPFGAANNTNTNMNDQFDGLDEEQLMSMFSNDFSPPILNPGVSSPNPSTPSDHNSNNDDKPTTPSDQNLKNESSEVQSTSDAALPPTSANGDPIVDPKRVKRIIANRQSAQRSRVRKLQYISELERSVTSLQTEVSVLSPRVAFLDHQRLVLNVDNSTLKQKIAALAQDKIFKDAHQEALRKEIERLKHVYHQQNLKKMGNKTSIMTAATMQPSCAHADTEGHPMN